MDNNNPCLFCREEKQKNEAVIENDSCFMIWDGFPVSQGHALIIPKNHVNSFFDLAEDQIVKIFSLMSEAKGIIQKKYSPDGFNIGVNDGVAAGRTIHHLHIHIIPRYIGDVAEPRGGVRHIIPGKGFY